jgi:hypothetical protein
MEEFCKTLRCILCLRRVGVGEKFILRKMMEGFLFSTTIEESSIFCLRGCEDNGYF